ncbi:acetyl-CoA C-acyltransferase [Rhodococcus sp. (in: high G+C Gram-positive bacteria)]|uniref:thiolase family protein n=1 Tax=Rhodococcus sp. TaxID=1831 RepID=UPI00257E61B8|nr:acetyl-CoA C-acyltransferase [Rhodococcus sp. (in: high G+C Gram-positive bacteria)]MBQ9054987.1 acetyl-CoA C-acyltransferase [Rhodococcus sp. (in: high G+C Gram-positive bacteria)]
MTEAVIVDAVRTPLAKGKPGGAYSEIHPVDLHAIPLRALVERAGIDPVVIDDVISGAVGQVGEQSGNTARWALLAAGYPQSVPGVTVDRQCGSSQQALHFAAQGVIAGAYDIAVASGVESMSRIPIGSQFAGKNFAGPTVTKRYAPGLIPQGISAELIAAKWGFSRAQLDDYAATSHQRAAQAWNDGRFAGETVAVNQLGTDETIRPNTTADTLAGLRLAFQDEAWETRFPQIDWKVTAGNSSPVNDAAAAILVTSREAAERHGLRPRARVHSFAVAGDDPIMMLTGIIPATQKVLNRAGLDIDDIDVFEVNEAFASVVLAWQAETGAPLEKVNINGGAIAIGHPLGGSGARLATTLLNALEQTGGRYGLQVMCEAGGQANATIIERL